MVPFESDSCLERIDQQCFIGTSVRFFEFPSKIQFLGLQCFSNCSFLETMAFDMNCELKHVEESCFAGSKLQRIRIPRNVETLEEKCFWQCKALKSVEFEVNCHLKKIGRKCFSESSLPRICIPSAVEHIGAKCFFKCISFESLDFESNSRLQSIGSYCFARSTLRKISHFPPIPNLSETAFSDCLFLGGSHDRDDHVSHVRAEGNFLINLDLRKIVSFLDDSFSVTIPKAFEIVGESSFSSCPLLEQIQFESSSSVRIIENYAFSRSSLHSICISSQTEIFEKISFLLPSTPSGSPF